MILKKEKIKRAVRLSETLGVPHGCIYKWKNGNTEPSLENTIKLAQKYPYAKKYLGLGKVG
jgi:hypothetical protein